MRFANIELIWLLVLAPAAALLCYRRIAVSRQRLERFAGSSIIGEVFPEFGRYSRRAAWESIAILAAVALIAAAILRPQIGFTWTEGKRRGADIMIALDVSDSMLAADVSPNRLERARRKIIDLLEQLEGDRVGLVSFAGAAFLEVPLTYDYATFRSFLASLGPELAPVQGTDIESALQKSINAFDLGAVKEGEGTKPAGRSRAILLLTDGEEFDGDMNRVRAQAEERGISIYIIGVGTAQGAPIPAAQGYKKDAKGNIVITRLQNAALAQLALDTGGIFVESVASDEDTKAVYEGGIHRVLQQKDIDGARSKRWNEYFQLPLMGALFVLAAVPFKRTFWD